MRRPVTAVTALAVTFALLVSSGAVLLTASSWSAGKADLRAAEDGPYTASADYTVAVPAIDQGNGWQTALQIQNTGVVPTSARIEFFGEVDVECPATREPLAVQCVGPIPAGAAHTFLVSSDPTLAEAGSAIVYSTQPSDAGCETLPGEPLAVVVQRTRVRDDDTPEIARSTYVGIAPAVAGFWEADQEAYITVIPWVEVSNTSQTILHVQNVGVECADEIELELISDRGCVPRQGTLPAIPSGQSLRVDLADEYTDDFRGSAWIRSPQPLAVVVDRRLNDGKTLATHATGPAVSHVAIDAPLVLQSAGGWNARLRTQNASAQLSAFVEAAYQAAEITPTLKIEGPICPGGSISIDTAAVPELTLPFTGTVTLRSLAMDPDLPDIPSLVTDVDILPAGGGAAYHAPNRITDTLTAPDIALPWLTRTYHPPTASLNLTYTSQIGVVNQRETGEGFISLTFYDPDGSITAFQPETPLGPRAMRIIDLADVSDLPAGWHGSAVLQFLSIQPGASVAVAVLETAPEISGDAMTGYAGIVTRVQAQPTSIPSPMATVTPTPTATPQSTATPATTQPPPLPNTYLPLLRK